MKKKSLKFSRYYLGLILSMTTVASLTPAYAGPDGCYVYYKSLTKAQKNIIDNLDFVGFYKDVLFNFRNGSKKEWLDNYDYVVSFHKKTAEMLKKEMSNEDILELAREVQDTGYYLPQKRDAIDNVKHPSLGAKINEAAIQYLQEIAMTNQKVQQGLDSYERAYFDFAEGGNKIKASKLGLNALTSEQQAEFFRLAGKQLTADQIAKVIASDDVVVNLFQQKFDDMRDIGAAIRRQPSRDLWNEKIVSNQINALVNSFIVSKISKELAVSNRYLSLTPEQRNKMIWMLYTYVGQYNGPAGYTADVLVRSRYEDISPDKLILDQTIDRVVSRKIDQLESRGLKLELMGVVKQSSLEGIVRNRKFSGASRQFVKVTPTFAIKITESNWDKLPDLLSTLGEGIGRLDKTDYPDGLRPYIGSILNLQLTETGAPDNPVGLNVFKSKYIEATREAITANNGKYENKIKQSVIGRILNSEDIVSVLKIAPTEMILMSQAGFDIAKAATIQAPWGGTQTKDAGKDAYLAILRNNDGSIKETYIVQIDESNGLPQSYIGIPARQ